MQIVYSKQAVKCVKSLAEPIRRRLKKSISGLPKFGDIRPIKGKSGGYRLRVGNLRVLYREKDDMIYIASILPRGQAYKKS